MPSRAAASAVRSSILTLACMELWDLDALIAILTARVERARAEGALTPLLQALGPLSLALLPRVYYGRGAHELTGSAISPQQNVQVSRVEGGDVEPPCVCPCCMTVSGRLVCCN
jgi:hypothetical protein